MPTAHLRPIVMLTLLRKVLSLVVLRRIRTRVDVYLSASQAGFRRGRSTADIVWAYRWLAAKATRYKSEIHILGLDMSRAFDTIDRAKLMTILKDEVGLEEDEMRLCQSLLANTNLTVKLGAALSTSFETTIGTPQGDGLSPILFAIYLESALKEVRAEASTWLMPAEDRRLPPEALYADDCDFVSTSTSRLKSLEELIPQRISRRNLQANPNKWERTKLAPSASKDEKADWRKTKKLGSLLGDEEDIERRKVLATVSFKSLRILWERRKVTSVSTRMRAYNAFVLPVLLYNCGTWGVTEGVMDKLEVFHRRQLREVLGVKTRDVHNVDLYKRCEACPLRSQIVYARWSLFGHTLRLARDTPAQLAMDYYSQLAEGEVEPLGRPDTTLPVLLFSEYRKHKKQERKRGWSVQQTKEKMLTELRGIAVDRQKWQELVASVCQIDSS